MTCRSYQSAQTMRCSCSDRASASTMKIATLTRWLVPFSLLETSGGNRGGYVAGGKPRNC
jgi:hypothetical protein